MVWPYSASVNRPIVLALCAWPMDKVWQTFTRQVLNVSTAISQSLSGTYNKKCWWRLQIAVETSQEWVIVCQSKSHCFHFPCSFCHSLHSSTRHNIQSHCFNIYTVVLFLDTLKTTASIPDRIKSQSVWTPGHGSLVTHQTQITDSSNCCPFLGQHSLRVFRSLKSLTG